jgi:hypothetical protein
VDDWDFANYGSFLSPNGFCEGSCQSEMWFYINKKSQGAPPLNKLYQNSLYPFRTTDLWADNILGIELASVVQSDVGLSLASLAGKIYSVSDTLTLDAFTYSMWVTGEPQLMGLSKFYMDVTHAIVAFRMDHGTIYVADPNFPGDTTRQVVYDPTAEAFKAYYSGDNAAATGTPYKYIIYFAKTALTEWNRLTERWDEFDHGTIGAGLFPIWNVTLTNLDTTPPEFLGGALCNRANETCIQTGADRGRF